MRRPRYKRVDVLLSLTVPSALTNTELVGYIEEAVYHWGGQRHPDDLLFTDERRDVEASIARVRRSAAL